MIAEDLLEKYGAILKHYEKNETLFSEEEVPHFYMQIMKGQVKMSNYNDEGKEFVQGVFTDGESFGEPPLFGNFPYPSNAIAVKSTKVWALPQDIFLKLLEENPKVHLEFTATLAKRLRYKAIMQAEISSNPPEKRVLRLIDYLKEEKEITDEYLVPLTRQQIADMTGLRVETVIRTIKKLEEEGELKIKDKKVYR
ncbi:Crp/Fnr family transcriptional regulator [Sediminitomix flava]|uniref:CRP-like cAMP-binding protein n=1 Tax=Sediminitomix flava TaxID=379075 RepID=A0A315Z8J7_SEDFL|nr:Crp/Fnr family transcriptional regulator [Sediminitomix flava]PWJ41076.1 CRP-like cAMP-binding protein [Sediminitomix flava]